MQAKHIFWGCCTSNVCEETKLQLSHYTVYFYMYSALPTPDLFSLPKGMHWFVTKACILCNTRITIHEQCYTNLVGNKCALIYCQINEHTWFEWPEKCIYEAVSERKFQRTCPVRQVLGNAACPNTRPTRLLSLSDNNFNQLYSVPLKQHYFSDRFST